MFSKKFVFATLLIGAILLTLSLNLVPSSAQGGVTGFSNVRVSNFFRAQPRTAITVTNNGTINASGSYTRLTSAAAVGTAGTSVTVEPAGTIMTLINVGLNTITITETGVFTSAGNITLGPGDASTLYSNGSAWTEVSRSNN
jgi:hypothetical protein